MKASGISLCLMAGAAMLCGCDSNKGWSVSGSVSNAADGEKIAVEGFNAGIWYNIDSVALDSHGAFAYTAPEGSPYPDIYRISYNGKSIFFPIDSLEHISITADAGAFDTEYTVSGYDVAEKMAEIDKRIVREVAAHGAPAVLADSVLKRELSTVVNDDASGVLGYYIINKTIGDTPLFSTASRQDVRVLGALANKFTTMFPGDPRTKYLEARFLQARRGTSPAAPKIIEADETGFIDIELYDAKGAKRKLGDVVRNAGMTILSFTSYNIEPSVAYNVELNRLAEKYRSRNIAIYQVAVDADEVEWRRNAAALPWTAVHYNGEDGGTLLGLYNVSSLPMTYIIDSNGDLVERIEDPTEIDAAIARVN